jgi:hypothetical protein
LNLQISIMGALSTALTGASVICFDSAGAARRAAAFQAFGPLGLRHAGGFCHAMANALVGLTEDRAAETIEKLRSLLARLDAPFGVLGLPQQIKPLMRGGLLYALGALEGFLDEPVALERADALESCGLRLYQMVACQIRAQYHGCRGQSTLARDYERDVERHAMRNGSTWQAEVWGPSSRVITCKLTYDLVGLRRAAEELERLSQDIPSLEWHARAARGALALLRGEHRTAIALLEVLRSESTPRAFIGWASMSSSLAEAYNETGQHARAEALCTEVLSGFTERDRNVVSLNLGIEIQLAVAEAGLGRIDEGAQRLDRLLRKHEANRGPVTLGALHRARVAIAMRSGDIDAARRHLAQMEAWFRSTENPALIAECERVTNEMRTPSAPPTPLSDGEPATVKERTPEASNHDHDAEAFTDLDTTRSDRVG